MLPDFTQSSMFGLLFTWLHSGFHAQDLALAIPRVGVGVFFAISGMNKLFHPVRHGHIRANLARNGIPAVWFFEWWVPFWEFVAGITLALGFMTAVSAWILMIVCIVASCCEARGKVAKYEPLNSSDVVACYLYLPEILYMLMLGVNIVAGGGAYSLDAWLWGV